MRERDPKMHTKSVAISLEFLEAMSRLPKAQQKKVRAFVSKFQKDPESSGINYERIQTGLEKGYRSVRIDKQYRGVVLRSEDRSTHVLLWVDKHDEAYDWASRNHCGVNAVTGSLQVYERRPPYDPGRNAGDRTPRGEGPISKPPIDVAPFPCGELSLDDLRTLGVPEELLEVVSNARSLGDIQELKRKLPNSAFEALYFLGDGMAWQEVRSAYASIPKEGVELEDLAAALTRPESRRDFWVVDDQAELEAVLAAPLERWRVFLHPAQRKLVERSWNGPVRVLGGAGTGKTVVAMHRARWLVRNKFTDSRQRILLTTFTANLALDIEQNLRKICTDDEMERMEVTHVDGWLRGFLRGAHYHSELVYNSGDPRMESLWAEALSLAPEALELPETFYREEFEKIVLGDRVESRASYLRVARAGRGVGLNRRVRAQIWPVFERLRHGARERKIAFREQAIYDAMDILGQLSVAPPYVAAVIDEAQDMGRPALSLLRKLIPEGPDDLFLVGDGRQRIYGRRTAMSHCGIRVVGRGRKLRIHYRTTEETRHFAGALLGGKCADDLDGGVDDSHGGFALTHGGKPEVKSFGWQADEENWVGGEIKRLVEEGILPRDICVVARTRKLVESCGNALRNAGHKVAQLTARERDDRAGDTVRLATMHRVKGLEFRYVFVVGVRDGIMPLSLSRAQTADPVEQERLEFGERALLHVASTRAVRRLYITYSGRPSPFLAEE